MVELANRAPSPHNIQPARWRRVGQQIELWEDASRWLAVGDPSGRDNLISLGMAWEGMAIAATAFGCALAEERWSAGAYPCGPGLRKVATGMLQSTGEESPRFEALSSRRTWRGKFAPIAETERVHLEQVFRRHAQIAHVLPSDAHRDCAEWHDLATVEAMDDPRFAAELHQWMRFTLRDTRWSRDGLAADCMLLGKLEALGASVLLRPAAVTLLSKLSLLRFFVAESDKTQTASALVAIVAPAHQSPWVTGRSWYRLWLDLCSEGFAGAPMSALGDSPRFRELLLRRYPIAKDAALINIMRIGRPLAHHEPPKSARLPLEEVILE